MSPSLRRLPVVAPLALLGVLWGITFPISRLGVEGGAPPFVLVLLDLLLAAGVTAPFALAGRGSAPSTHRALESAGAGALLIGGINLPLYWGVQFAPGSLASIFYASSPLLSLVLLRGLGQGKHLGLGATAALVLGLLGVAEVADVSGGAMAANPWGLAAFAVGAICQGVGAVLLGRVRPSGEDRWGEMFQFLGAAGVTAVAVLVAREPLTLPSTVGAVFSIVYVGAISMAVGYGIFFRLLREEGAVRANQVTLINPLAAVVFGVAILREAFQPAELLGLALVLVALLLLELPAASAAHRPRGEVTPFSPAKVPPDRTRASPLRNVDRPRPRQPEA